MAARTVSNANPHDFVDAPKRKDFIGDSARPHEGSNDTAYFVVTELERRHGSVARRRTIDKRDQSFLILPQRYKVVKQFVNTKFA